MVKNILILLFICLLCILEIRSLIPKPNFVFIVADDLGWNDVSFHGSSQIPTPNINRLAKNGIILDNYYVLPICTPTRSAILTGRYPIHTGMQSDTIHPGETWGIGLNETLISEYLKRQGYKTHAIGKWHVGFYMKELTPTFRGFDSFYGYYNGKSDYWDHSDLEAYWGLDLHKDMEPVYTQWGNYSTEMFTAEAESKIHDHDASEPLFLYLAYQAVHSANTAQDPLQAPKAWIDKFEHIKHRGRRVYAAVVAYMDYCIGRVYKALEKKGMLPNTIIIFTTDNGGPANGFDWNWANNYPLRGMKASVFEGGVRGAGFIYSQLLRKSDRISKDLMHVTDWLPTIVNLAGGELPSNLDGVDQWDTLRNRKISARNEVLLNIDDKIWNNSALIVGHWKIVIEGTSFNKWYAPPNIEYPSKNVTVSCHGNIPTKNITNCKDDTKYGYCLFNLEDDPCEIHDLSTKHFDIGNMLMKRLQTYRDEMVTPKQNYTIDPRANPKLYNGVWEPWMNL